MDICKNSPNSWNWKFGNFFQLKFQKNCLKIGNFHKILKVWKLGKIGAFLNWKIGKIHQLLKPNFFPFYCVFEVGWQTS
jgi:hypothetical protein